jgi:glucan phosphoethanolaminetransferase (alkaline phosphatase superfamily)
MISMIFFIGMIYFYNMTGKSEIVKNYKKTLPADLQKRYEMITAERKKLSYQGYALGVALSICLIIYNTQLRSERMSTSGMICLVIATAFLTNYFYYVLSPKSDWVLNHTTNQEQVKNWLKMYREMSFNYHAGLALGIVAVGVLAFAFKE